MDQAKRLFEPYLALFLSCSTSSFIGFSSSIIPFTESPYRWALRTLTSDIHEVSQKMAGPRLPNSHHLLWPLRCLSSDSSQVLMWALFSSTLFPVVSRSVPGAELDSSAASLQEPLLPNSFNKGPGNSDCTALGYLPSLNQSLQMVEVGRGEQCSDQDWVGVSSLAECGEKWFPREN